MTRELSELSPGEDLVLELGDALAAAVTGLDTIAIGPMPFDVRIDLNAYHEGVGPGGKKAWLTLFMDQVQIGHREDHEFDTYNLTIDRHMAFTRGASATFLIQWGNEVATTKKIWLTAKITRI